MLTNKRVFILIVCMLFPFNVFSLETNSVSVEADQYAVSGQPIEVSVMVTHERTSKVDLNHFKLGENPLKVRFVKDISLSENSNLIISIYKFTLRPQKKGLYSIPPVTVKIGGKTYASYEASYDVR